MISLDKKQFTNATFCGIIYNIGEKNEISKINLR